MGRDYYNFSQMHTGDSPTQAEAFMLARNHYTSHETKAYVTMTRIPVRTLDIIRPNELRKTNVTIGSVPGESVIDTPDLFDLAAAFNLLKGGGNYASGGYKASLTEGRVQHVDTFLDRLNTAIRRAFIAWSRSQANTLISSGASHSFTYSATPSNSAVSTLSTPTGGTAWAPVGVVSKNIQLTLLPSSTAQTYSMRIKYAIDNQGYRQSSFVYKTYHICTVAPLTTRKTVTFTLMSDNMPETITDTTTNSNMQPASAWDTAPAAFIEEYTIFNSATATTAVSSSLANVYVEFVLGPTTIGHVTNKTQAPFYFMKHVPDVKLMMTDTAKRQVGLESDAGFFGTCYIGFDTNTTKRLGANVDRHGHIVPHPLCAHTSSIPGESDYSVFDTEACKTFFDSLGSYLHDVVCVDVCSNRIPIKGEYVEGNSNPVLMSIYPSFDDHNLSEAENMVQSQLRGSPNHIHHFTGPLHHGAQIGVFLQARYKNWDGAQLVTEKIDLEHGDCWSVGLCIEHPSVTKEEADLRTSMQTPVHQDGDLPRQRGIQPRNVVVGGAATTQFNPRPSRWSTGRQ